jgi:hypothetical protein
VAVSDYVDDGRRRGEEGRRRRIQNGKWEATRAKKREGRGNGWNNPTMGSGRMMCDDPLCPKTAVLDL